MIVAQRLKTARQACKLTQNQVAEILGIDRSAYTYYETGKTSPSLTNLLRLASIFKVEVAWLLGEADPSTHLISAGDDALSLMKAVSESRMADLSREERQLVAFYRMMRGEGRGDAVLKALKSARDAAPDAAGATGAGGEGERHETL